MLVPHLQAELLLSVLLRRFQFLLLYTTFRIHLQLSLLLLLQRHSFVHSLCFYCVWLYCVILEPRLDSTADCICFTQTHQERDIIEIPCLAYTFGFLSRHVYPALLFSFKLQLFSFIYFLCVTLFVFFLLLSFGICLPIQSEILPS